MKAYKVVNAGTLSYRTPKIVCQEIVRTTKTRVYFSESRFENITTYDVHCAHSWFLEKKEAKEYALSIIKKKLKKLVDLIDEFDNAEKEILKS